MRFTGQGNMRRPFNLSDRVVALLLLVPAIPVIALAALCIVVVHRQTPFFAAHRVGMRRLPFTMWKLRTMCGVDDGLPTGGPKQAQITPIGRVLRRTRFDELPQLWNILTGDMALLGMRPPTAWAVSRQPKAFAEILTRPPGLTGLSTVLLAEEESRTLALATNLEGVAGLYEEKILPCKLKTELYYRRHRSLGMDLWILRVTLRLILGRSAAHLNANKAEWDGNEAGLEHSFSTIHTRRHNCPRFKAPHVEKRQKALRNATFLTNTNVSGGGSNTGDVHASGL
ncbi:MAG TPA: sugar transferase [Marivita sp.]|nr:sugar transferase [Marivita sp.]